MKSLDSKLRTNVQLARVGTMEWLPSCCSTSLVKRTHHGIAGKHEKDKATNIEHIKNK